MVFIVTKLCALRFSSSCFTFHVSCSQIVLNSLHPLHLADFFQLNVKGHPWARHLGVDLTQASFSHASARAMAHELRAFGFERIVGNRGTLMDPTGVLSAFVFPRDDHAF
jgi:hypothetical protein